jgi:hypothetical protein
MRWWGDKVKVERHKCVNCGGTLGIQPLAEFAVCEYCQSLHSIKRDHRGVQADIPTV